MIMTNIIEQVVADWKEQDKAIEAGEQQIQSGRDHKADTLASVSKAEGWTAESLKTAEGAGRKVITSILSAYHGCEAKELSKSEVAKFASFAHPKVRGRLPALRKAAEAERKRVAPHRKNLKRDDVLAKYCKHMKSENVSTVETATGLVKKEYDKSIADATAQAAKPEHEKAHDRLKSAVESATLAKGYTKASIDNLKAAFAALELAPVKEAVPEEETADIADVLAPVEEAGAEEDTADIADMLASITPEQTKGLIAALLSHAIN